MTTKDDIKANVHVKSLEIAHALSQSTGSRSRSLSVVQYDIVKLFHAGSASIYWR